MLLDAACRVFAARGYHAASIEEIAQAAGITKPVIYHHFGSKRQLHRAVFEHYGRQLLETAASHGTEGTPRERFHELVASMFAFAHQSPHIWRLLLGDSTDPETAELQQRLRAAGTEQSAARLVAQPTFRPTTRLGRRKAAEVIAELTRSAVDSLVTWSLQHPNIPREHLVQTATDLLWAGLADTSADP